MAATRGVAARTTVGAAAGGGRAYVAGVIGEGRLGPVAGDGRVRRKLKDGAERSGSNNKSDGKRREWDYI